MTSSPAPTFKARQFGQWIEANGGFLREPTSEWEVIRYDLAGEIHSIYRNSKGRLTLAGKTADHYHTFRAGAAFGVVAPKGKSREKLVVTLLGRDGDCCVICGDFLGDDITVEHWLARDAGGSNDPRNLGLAHDRCNQRVGNLPITEKLRIRDECLAKRETTPPWENVS